MPRTNTQLDAVLKDRADALIRSNLRSAEDRAKLERAAYEAVLKYGYEVDEVSAVTGLRPDEIRALLERPVVVTDEVEYLAGLAS